jgi:UDP-2,3-diacylglucosamine pyrophosphatase LpxH
VQIRIEDHDLIAVISDLHAGPKNYCAFETLMKTLESFSHCRYIIFNGDLLDGSGPISDDQFPLIDFLSKNRERIIYIRGNHDPVKKGLCQLLGLEVVKRQVLYANEKKICVIHGDKFDSLFRRIFTKYRVLDKMFLRFIRAVEKVPVLRRLVYYFHNKFSMAVERKSARYAQRGKLDMIICGHTHLAKQIEVSFKEGRKIEYINCGSFVRDHPCSYVTINGRGEAKLHYVLMEN